MRAVWLLRHAKSSWDDPFLADHERPLNKRGRRDAPRIGRRLAEAAEAGEAPERVLCSTAVRARQTLALALEAWEDAAVEVEEREDLYPTDPEHCLALLAAQPEGCDRVMLVGHNPGLEALLTALTGREERLPTAALAEITLDIDDWPELDGAELDRDALDRDDLDGPRRGRLARLWRPKESAPARAPEEEDAR